MYISSKLEWYMVTEQAKMISFPQVLIKYNIPLILWDKNRGLKLGDMKTVGKTEYDGRVK